MNARCIGHRHWAPHIQTESNTSLADLSPSRLVVLDSKSSNAIVVFFGIAGNAGTAT